MVVDAAQAAPHRAVDVQALGADFVAITGHKLCGPTGIGALWGRRELLDAMSPFNLGGEMIRSVGLDKTSFNEVPHKFEAGHARVRRGHRPRRRDRLRHGRRARGDRASRARARRADDGRVRRDPVDPRLRSAGRAPRRDRLVRRRGDPPARRRADPRLGGDRRARRPPLHAAADDAPRRRGHDPRELLSLLDPRGGRAPRRGAAQGEGVARHERVRAAVPRGHPRPLQGAPEPRGARAARRDRGGPEPALRRRGDRLRPVRRGRRDRGRRLRGPGLRDQPWRPPRC